MLLLKKLTIENFLSHEKTIIEFEGEENTLIDGASGAGKSTIFDAIIWCLYGQARSENRSLVRKGVTKGGVSLEVRRKEDEDSEDDVFIITRCTTQTGKHTVDVAIEKGNNVRESLPLGGIRDVQAWIDKELVGASYLLFVNSVAYVQGNSENFVTQTAPKRKELLLEIVKAEDYGKYYENARKALSNLSVEDSSNQGVLSVLQTNLGAINAVLSTRTGLVENLIEENSKLQVAEENLKKAEEHKEKVMTIVNGVNLIKSTLYAAEKDRDSIVKTIKEKEDKILGRKYIDPAILEAKKAALLDKRTKISEAGATEAARNSHYAKRPTVSNKDAEIKRQEDMISLLNSKESCPSMSNCPYHSKTLDSLEFCNKEIERLREIVLHESTALAAWIIDEMSLPPSVDISTMLKEADSIQWDIKVMEGIIKDNEVLNDIEKEIPDLIDKMTEKLSLIRDLEEKVKEGDKVIKEAGYDLFAFPSNMLDSEIRKEKEIVNSIKETISRTTISLENIDKAENDKKTTEEKINDIKIQSAAIQEKAKKVAMVKDAFGSKGIETLVIDYLLPKLEDRINAVLSKLSDFRVRLDTQKKSADGESTIEGLFITILNEMNEEMPFENYSGGEKLKISVAISESLATLQKVGFRLFDETFIGLDENSTESFATVLGNLTNEFSQVLCISHLLQIKELFDKKITVTKTKNVSFIDK